MTLIGSIGVMAVIAIIIAVVTDAQMAKCQSGSLYAIFHLCKPDRSSPKAKSFDCEFNRGTC
jgi:hypothetical protein